MAGFVFSGSGAAAPGLTAILGFRGYKGLGFRGLELGIYGFG